MFNSIKSYVVGSAATLIISKVAGQYAWDTAKSQLQSAFHTGAAMLLTTAKASGLMAGAVGVGAAGYALACKVHQKTDLTRGDGFDLLLNGWNEGKVQRINTIAPAAIFITSLAGSALFAYSAVRQII